MGARSNGRFRTAEYTSNDIQWRASQDLLPQQVIFLLSPSFAGRDQAANYSVRYAATACARKMPALNKARTPATIKLTVCVPAQLKAFPQMGRVVRYPPPRERQILRSWQDRALIWRKQTTRPERGAIRASPTSTTWGIVWGDAIARRGGLWRTKALPHMGRADK
jgi:hypothetical protein